MYNTCMSLKAYQIQCIADYLTRYKGERVGKILQYSKDVFSFRLGRAGRVAIVLDNQSPTLFLGGDEAGKTSLSTPASALFRKRLSGAEFVGARQVNEDRVLALDFIAVNDIFEPDPLSLVLELIPTKANMALLDQQGKILYAFRPNNILDPRPIFHGILYEPPLKKGEYSDEAEPFDVAAYFESCHGLEEKLQSRRKDVVFQGFFRDLNAKIKSCKRKIAQIEADIQKGMAHLGDAEYGNYIYTYPEQFKTGDVSFDYYGIRVALDPLKSPQENALEFFRKAKKAKNAVALGEENLAKAKRELAEALELKEFASSCDEEALTRLFEGKDGKKKHMPKGKQAPQKARGPLPYIAKGAGFYVYFGKSAKQNDFLSFLYATKPSFLWFHAKDAAGAHVILPKENPSDPEIEFACMIALLASERLDGEVQYTEHRNIRRGSVPGQVILGNYRSAMIRNISESALKAYENALERGAHG